MPLPLLGLLSLLACACSTRAAPQATDSPPRVAREFRAAWVATVNNSDWPSRPGLSSQELRAELDAIVARAADLGLNALVFQVRPCADAFYKSPVEPWSEWLTGTQGQAPDGDFDPLAHVIARCHERGLSLHAWFNPYRARHERSKSPPAKSHVSQKAPQVVVKYGDYEWMDPGEPLAAQWSLAILQDVVQRYDVDGVHIDDYFYPYPQGKVPFPDDASFAKYRDGGGKLGRSDWRRANIDEFVRRMYAVVHEAKPWVQVGISPFGIARPGVPKGIQAGIDQYEQLSADVLKWLREGWLDYLAPQLYWPIDQTPQSFPVLLQWWHTQNPQARAIWPGLNAGKMIAGGKGIRPNELREEVTLVRQAAVGRSSGHVHFPFKPLRRDDANGGAMLREMYREPALVPAMPWLGGTPPQAPTARLLDGGRRVSFTTDAATRLVAVQVRDRSGWRTATILPATTSEFAVPSGSETVALTAVSKTGIASTPALVSVR
ncbi:MAG: family 10 glycosylhydrolase [Planctomycetota bacterium]